MIDFFQNLSAKSFYGDFGIRFKIKIDYTSKRSFLRFISNGSEVWVIKRLFDSDSLSRINSKELIYKIEGDGVLVVYESAHLRRVLLWQGAHERFRI